MPFIDTIVARKSESAFTLVSTTIERYNDNIRFIVSFEPIKTAYIYDVCPYNPHLNTLSLVQDKYSICCVITGFTWIMVVFDAQKHKFTKHVFSANNDAFVRINCVYYTGELFVAYSTILRDNCIYLLKNGIVSSISNLIHSYLATIDARALSTVDIVAIGGTLFVSIDFKHNTYVLETDGTIVTAHIVMDGYHTCQIFEKKYISIQGVLTESRVFIRSLKNEYAREELKKMQIIHIMNNYIFACFHNHYKLYDMLTNCTFNCIVDSPCIHVSSHHNQLKIQYMRLGGQSCATLTALPPRLPACFRDELWDTAALA